MEQTTIRQDRQPHWYAMWVYRSLVSPIITACERDGVTTYRPMRIAEIFTDRGLEYGEEPIVPNLLFVKASCEYVIGLKQMTQNRGRAYCYPGTAIPAEIEDKTMEMFMFVVKCGARRLEPVSFPIDKGDRVRVTEGLFKGAEGYIRRVHGTKLLVVAIEGVVAVAVSHIPRQWLERIGPPRTERFSTKRTVMSRIITRTPSELTAQIAWVRSIALTEALSDNAVASLVKIYVALHNLVVTCSLDDTYGERKIYGKALDRLQRICLLRCSGTQPFARRSRMASVLHYMLYAACGCTDSDKLGSCCECGEELIAAWSGSHPDTSDPSDRPLEYGILGNIADLCYSEPEEDRDDEAFRYFTGRIAEWTAAIDGNGEWPDVPEDEALQRVDILCRNSYMLLDGTHDRQIERLYDRYYERITGRLAGSADMTVDDCRTLALLYELAMYYMPCEADYDKIAHIIQLAQEGMHTLPEESDAHLICRAIYIDRLCMQKGQEIQDRFFGNIA